MTDEIHLNFEFIKETLLASQKGRPETIVWVCVFFFFNSTNQRRHNFGHVRMYMAPYFLDNIYNTMG